MIIWCAYCQHFLKETAPFELLNVSHGMCATCSKNGMNRDDADHEKLKQLVQLQKELYAAGHSGDLSRIEQLIRDCKSIGVRPIDMIFGFLNPMLIKMGALWEQGQVSVIEEHRFTHFCEQLLQALKAKSTIKKDRPRFVLASADGNYHNFGLQILHLWLEARECPADLITPSLPMDELLDYTLEVRPEFVGLSVSLAEQVPPVQAYVHALTDTINSPVRQIFIGGYAVKAGLVGSAELTPALLINDPEGLVPYLSERQSLAS